ncbi:unnamed protein product [Absidia cylindrospora]
MAFLRLIRRSLPNKFPKLGPEGLHYHPCIQQQHHSAWPNQRQFYSTTTTTNQHVEAAAAAEAAETDTAAASLELQENNDDTVDLENNDLFKGYIPNIKIEGRTTDEIWADYLHRLEDPTANNLKECDYIIICMALKKDKNSPTSIKRIQTLLRHLNERGDRTVSFTRCCNMLMYLYLEQRDLNSARLVFDGLLRSEKYQLSNVSVSTLLSGIAQLGTAKDALALYKSLSRQGLFPNSIGTYRRLIKVLGVDFGHVDSCVSIFDKLLNDTSGMLPTPNIEIYNTMFIMYRFTKQPDRAWALYCQSLMSDGSNVTPDLATYYTLLKTLQQLEDGDGNRATRIQTIYNDMQRLGLKITASHYQAMGWDPLEVLRTLKKDGSQLTVNDYNLLISSAVKDNKFEDALAMFQEMWKEGDDVDDNGNGIEQQQQQQQLNRVSPDVYTYGIIMDALVKDIEQSVSVVYDVYEEMKQQGVLPDVVVYSCLLQACSRDGSMDRAVGYLEEMQEFKIRPNTYILNNFLGVLSQKPVKEKQDMYCARALWDQMIAIGVYPDTRAFNQYLSLLSQFVPTVDPKEIKSARSRMEQDGGGGDLDLFGDNSNNDSIPMGGIPMSGTAKYMMNIYRTMRHSKGKLSRPDFLSYSILINTMIAQGQTRQAMVIFRDAQLVNKKLGVDIYNTIMEGLLRDNDLHQIMHMWQDMKANRVLPDRVSYDLVLDACEQLHLAESFTTIMQQRKLDNSRLARLDEARERRWTRSKSIKQRHHRDSADDQHDLD